jgi:hypothetical protein
MQQQTVGFCLPGLLDLRAEPEQRQQATRPAHSHAQVDDDKVGIGRKVNGLPLCSHNQASLHRHLSRTSDALGDGPY